MSRPSSPQVTVVIPTFNREQLITATLKSVQAQRFRDFEVIVVDDGSTDETARAVQTFVEGDARFRYERLSVNSNLPAVPRNRGIELARGEYVAFLDSDDLWLPWKLQRQVHVLDSHPELALIHSHLWLISATSKRIGLQTVVPPSSRHADFEILRRRNVVQCSSTMVRADILRSLGGFDERPALRAIEDYHLWARISREHAVGYLSEIQGRYRVSLTGTGSQQSAASKHNYLNEYEGFDCVNPHDFRPPSRFAFYRDNLRGLYYHLVDAQVRRLIGAQARIW